MTRDELKKLIKEMILNETPDGVKLKASGKLLVRWRMHDAYPFGYINGKMKVGDSVDAHWEICERYDDIPMGSDRGSFKYAGRIWTDNKIISFWDYPPFGDLKKTLMDIQKEIGRMWEKNINIMTFRIDIPANTVDGSYDTSFDDSWGLASKPSATYKNSVSQGAIGSKYWEDSSYLYAVKNVLKPNFELKGQGKEWKKSSGDIKVNKDIQHIVSPLLKKGKMDKLNPEQKKALSDYFARKGNLDKDEIRMWKMIARRAGIKEARELVSEYLSMYRPVRVLKESPDQIWVGPDHDKVVAMYWSTGTNHPFGYKGNRMRVGPHSETHYTLGGRESLKYAGRIWTDRKIISFWEYPPLNKLKKVLKDIEQEFDRENKAYDDMIERGGGGRRFTDTNKPLKITDNWKIDIPAMAALSHKNKGTYSDATGGLRMHDLSGEKSYLYKLSTVFSNKPLKGIGPELRKGGEVKLDSKDIQHQIPAMLRKGAANKLTPQAKKDLYNYFKGKGTLDKAEKRMWNLINKGMREHLGYSLVDMINEYYSPKKTFTLTEGEGILIEAPHISVGDKAIDLEFEKGKIEGLKRILAIIVGKEVVDKYGNKFKLSSPKELGEFISVISRNSQVKREL